MREGGRVGDGEKEDDGRDEWRAGAGIEEGGGGRRRKKKKENETIWTNKVWSGRQ